MSVITVEIKAPEIIEALNTLIGVLKAKETQGTPFIPSQSAPAAMPAPVPTASTPISAPAPAAPAYSPAEIPAPPVTVPTAAPPAYTFDQLAVAATPLLDSGQRNAILELLGKFGVQSLTALPEQHYGAFATGLRALGARI